MSRNLKLGLTITLFTLTVPVIGTALLLSAAAALAYMGILADVGPAENRAMGQQALLVAGVAWVVALALLVTALLMLRAFRRAPKPQAHRPAGGHG